MRAVAIARVEAERVDILDGNAAALIAEHHQADRAGPGGQRFGGDDPNRIVPRTTTLTGIAPTFDLTLAPFSISVLEIEPRTDHRDR